MSTSQAEHPTLRLTKADLHLCTYDGPHDLSNYPGIVVLAPDIERFHLPSRDDAASGRRVTRLGGLRAESEGVQLSCDGGLVCAGDVTLPRGNIAVDGDFEARNAQFAVLEKFTRDPRSEFGKLLASCKIREKLTLTPSVHEGQSSGVHGPFDCGIAVGDVAVEKTKRVHFSSDFEARGNVDNPDPGTITFSRSCKIGGGIQAPVSSVYVGDKIEVSGESMVYNLGAHGHNVAIQATFGSSLLITGYRGTRGFVDLGGARANEGGLVIAKSLGGARLLRAANVTVGKGITMDPDGQVEVVGGVTCGELLSARTISAESINCGALEAATVQAGRGGVSADFIRMRGPKARIASTGRVACVHPPQLEATAMVSAPNYIGPAPTAGRVFRVTPLFEEEPQAKQTDLAHASQVKPGGPDVVS